MPGWRELDTQRQRVTAPGVLLRRPTPSSCPCFAMRPDGNRRRRRFWPSRLRHPTARACDRQPTSATWPSGSRCTHTRSATLAFRRGCTSRPSGATSRSGPRLSMPTFGASAGPWSSRFPRSPTSASTHRTARPWTRCCDAAHRAQSPRRHLRGTRRPSRPCWAVLRSSTARRGVGSRSPATRSRQSPGGECCRPLTSCTRSSACARRRLCRLRPSPRRGCGLAAT